MVKVELGDRIRGCLLAGAVGDALGAAVEFISLDQIRSAYGVEGLTRYEATYGRIGAATDDTQMTLFSAEGLVLAARRFRKDDGDVSMPEMVYRAYLRWLVTQDNDLPLAWQGRDVLEEGWLMQLPDMHARRAPGKTCIGALQGGVMGTANSPVNDSKGCGAVMRAAPFGLTAHTPVRAFDLGVQAGALTHGHPSGYLAAGAMAAMVMVLREGSSVSQAVDTAVELVGAQDHGDGAEVVAALTGAVALAQSGKEPDAATIEGLGAGFVGEEALAIAVYCALVARDVRHGILLAINHSGDSDSTGSITGNLLGTARGADAIPEEWIAALELREAIEGVAGQLVDEFWQGR